MKNLFFCAAFILVGILMVAVVYSKNDNKGNSPISHSTQFLINPVFGEVTAEVQTSPSNSNYASAEYDYSVNNVTVTGFDRNSCEWRP